MGLMGCGTETATKSPTSSTATSSGTETMTEITGIEVDVRYEGVAQSYCGLNDYTVYSTSNSIVVKAIITSFQRYTIKIYGQFYNAGDTLLGNSPEMTVQLPGMPGYGTADIKYNTANPSTVKKCIIVISAG
jgi:hypothetical protein